MTSKSAGPMNTRDDVEQQVRDLILEKFPLARGHGMHDGENLLESGILDSLGILDLVNFLEQRYHILLADEELVPENFQTIQAVAEFVRRKTT